MIYPGEYGQPLLRVTKLECPMVAGKVTARLQVGGLVHSATSDGLTGSGYVDNNVQVTVENTGVNTVALQLIGTNDYVSGPRENVGPAKTINVRGRTVYNVTPRHTYLEVWATTGTGHLRMQLSSRLRYSELGFDERDPNYPLPLWSPKLKPGGPPPGFGVAIPGPLPPPTPQQPPGGWPPTGGGSTSLPTLPPGYDYVTDSNGSYVVDSNGNYIIVKIS